MRGKIKWLIYAMKSISANKNARLEEYARLISKPKYVPGKLNLTNSPTTIQVSSL